MIRNPTQSRRARQDLAVGVALVCAALLALPGRGQTVPTIRLPENLTSSPSLAVHPNPAGNAIAPVALQGQTNRDSASDSPQAYLPAELAASNTLPVLFTNLTVVEGDERHELSALPPRQVSPQARAGQFGSPPMTPSRARERLELARHLRTVRQTLEATPVLVELLGEKIPAPIQQAALLELAALAQDELNLSRALQVYAQFAQRWPHDLRIPEVLLRQGEIFRQMGLNSMALTKFYAVMTSALVLKSDQFDYYASLVLRAQTEIAETHYRAGRHTEAAECLARLLKQETAVLDRPHILYKLIRSQMAVDRYEDAVGNAEDYLSRYTNAPERPEVQFHLATALKQLGRDSESLQHVLTLLSEQRAHANERPEVWAYWQQRTGNVVANQLYREGDYAKALDIYTSLAGLDTSPLWQLPVSYQIGMTYERLMQPQKATDAYTGILNQEKQFPTNPPPSLKAVFDMARWRIKFIEWQEKAEAANRSLRPPAALADISPPAPLASLPKPSPALP
jgi:tetratricopeptide (TPR) repeat protein